MRDVGHKVRFQTSQRNLTAYIAVHLPRAQQQEERDRADDHKAGVFELTAESGNRGTAQLNGENERGKCGDTFFQLAFRLRHAAVQPLEAATTLLWPRPCSIITGWPLFPACSSARMPSSMRGKN